LRLDPVAVPVHRDQVHSRGRKGIREGLGRRHRAGVDATGPAATPYVRNTTGDRIAMLPDIRVRPTMTEANSTWALQRAASVRTAFVLALLALGFFGAILVAQFYAQSMIGIAALGLALIGFPLAVVVGTGR